MIVDELILKLQADLGDIKKSLKQVEADAAKAGKEAGSKMGKEAGTSFGDVFNAIAGAAVLNTVKGFFSKAAAEFNKMEAAMMRVESIAKGFGRSIEGAKKQVNELADKGFLNLNQAASSYADAIALGFDEKQARKFIDSLSDIAAYQNTIGSGSEALVSGLSGLLSNSAEKVENIGVPIKVLNQEYQKNIATMGKAAALQKFYAGTLKESEKFQGDAARSVDTLAGAQNKYNAAVDKAQVAIGKGLEPMLKALYATGQQLALAFANWFGGLNSTTKSLALMAPIVGAVVLALGTVIPVLKAISLSNPFGWIALAITGLIALTAALNEVATVNVSKIVKSYKESSAAIKEQGDRVKELEAINKRTASQEKELIDIKDKLRARAKALGVDYDQLAKSAGSAAAATAILTNKEREREANKLRTELKNVMDDREKLESRVKFISDTFGHTNGLDIGLGMQGLSVDTIRGAQAKRQAELVQGIADIYQPDATGNAPAVAALANSGAKETRFLESAEKLKEIEKNLVFTIARAKGDKKIDQDERKRRIDAAIEDARQQVDAEFGARRQAYAEYIEDKYMADTEALKKSTDDAIRASNEMLEAQLTKKKLNEGEILDLQADNEIRIQNIREANARKQAQITLQSFADTANAANTTASAAVKLGSSRDAGGMIGGAGGVLSGLSGFSDKLKPLGIVGQGLGAAAGVIGTISSLFGKSEEDKQREAAETQRRHEEQLKILQLQEDHQKNMLALAEQQAKTPFENLQRNLRLIDIQGQQQRLSGVPQATIDAQRLSARQSAFQGVLSEQGGKIAEGALFGDVQATPESLIAFMNKRAEEALAISQFNALIQSTQDPNTSINRIKAIYDLAQGYSGKIPSELFNTGIKGLKVAADFMDSSKGVTSDDVFSAISNTRSAASVLLSEISTDTSRAESLVSVLQDSLANQIEIKDATRKTAENTSKALELRPDRERSFIDVGAGFIQSLGQRITSPSGLAIAQQLSQQNFSVSGDIGTASVTSSRARTLQERMADALEKQLAQGATANDILRDIRALTYDLIAVMDGDASTGSSFSQQDFINFSSDVKRRRVA